MNISTPQQRAAVLFGKSYLRGYSSVKHVFLELCYHLFYLSILHVHLSTFPLHLQILLNDR